MFLETVSVIVHGAKGLKASKKGNHKFGIIFGIGSNKFRTDIVEDFFGNPAFNTECQVPIDVNEKFLKFKVTEKSEKDLLGVVTIPLDSLGHDKSHKPNWYPLQSHKKCQNPEGEIRIEAWIDTTGSIGSNEESKKSGIGIGIQKIKDKLMSSPKANRKQQLDVRRSSTSSSIDQLSFQKPDECSLSSFDSVSEQHQIPEVTGISPKEGPIEGGTKLIIRGAHLGINKEDVIGLFVCGANLLSSLEYISSKKLICITKPWRPSVGTVTIETQSGGRGSSLVQFTFIGGTGVGVGMAGSGDKKFDSIDLKRNISNRSTSSDNTTLESNLKSNLVSTSSFDISKHKKSNSGPSVFLNHPEITGLSPVEGPFHLSTRITIRGTNLGASIDDIILLEICGQSCLETLEYSSPSKLFCFFGPTPSPSSGHVTIKTRGGGECIAPMKFSFIDPSVQKLEEIKEIKAQYVQPTAPVAQPRMAPPIVEIQPIRIENNSDYTDSKIFIQNENQLAVEKKIKISDDLIKQLQIENKELREENERLRKYMETIVSRAIEMCPQILVHQ